VEVGYVASCYYGDRGFCVLGGHLNTLRVGEVLMPSVRAAVGSAGERQRPPHRAVRFIVAGIEEAHDGRHDSDKVSRAVLVPGVRPKEVSARRPAHQADVERSASSMRPSTRIRAALVASACFNAAHQSARGHPSGHQGHAAASTPQSDRSFTNMSTHAGLSQSRCSESFSRGSSA
jgi:hypothetical protein